MTNQPNDRFGYDPALAALHEEILADDVDGAGDDLEDDVEAQGAGYAQLLSPDMFNNEVRAYVDEVLRPGQPPAPALQHRMSDTARRVLRNRRLPLPVLLADARLNQQLSAGEVAVVLGVDEATLHNLEFGDTEIRSLDPAQVAAWSQTVKLEPIETIASLRKTLTARTAAPSQVAAGAEADAGMAQADEDFVTEVERLLGL